MPGELMSILIFNVAIILFSEILKFDKKIE